MLLLDIEPFRGDHMYAAASSDACRASPSSPIHSITISQLAALHAAEQSSIDLAAHEAIFGERIGINR